MKIKFEQRWWNYIRGSGLTHFILFGIDTHFSSRFTRYTNSISITLLNFDIIFRWKKTIPYECSQWSEEEVEKLKSKKRPTLNLEKIITENKIRKSEMKNED